ncbi:hypothetical protein GH714_032511 [Hevea brasiliensis]|uniref:Uncharacterized protein n=1 Tax=Hevea brasiliensis TaxID=3981 RepID=A0A6A6LPA5_HEVBR|nr:hypothetical protein GH714_032511 [Hevea brasiliensis]
MSSVEGETGIGKDEGGQESPGAVLYCIKERSINGVSGRMRMTRIDSTWSKLPRLEAFQVMCLDFTSPGPSVVMGIEPISYCYKLVPGEGKMQRGASGAMAPKLSEILIDMLEI